MVDEVRGAQIADGTYTGTTSIYGVDSDGHDTLKTYNRDGSYNKYIKDAVTEEYVYNGTYNSDGTLNGKYQPNGDYHEYVYDADGNRNLYNRYDANGNYVDTRNVSDDSLNGKYNSDFSQYTEYNADGTATTTTLDMRSTAQSVYVSGGPTDSLSADQLATIWNRDIPLRNELMADAAVVNLPPPGFVAGTPAPNADLDKSKLVLTEASLFNQYLNDLVKTWPDSDPSKQSTLDLLKLIDQGLAAMSDINYQMQTSDTQKKQELEQAMFDKQQDMTKEAADKLKEIKDALRKAADAREKSHKWGIASIVIGVIMTAVAVAVAALTGGLASPLLALSIAFTAAAIGDQASGGQVSKWTTNILGTLVTMFASKVCGADAKQCEWIDAACKILTAVLIAFATGGMALGASASMFVEDGALTAEVIGMSLAANNPTAEICDASGASDKVTLALTIITTILFIAVGMAGAKKAGNVEMMTKEDVQTKLDSLQAEADAISAKTQEVNDLTARQQELQQIADNRALTPAEQTELNGADAVPADPDAVPPVVGSPRVPSLQERIDTANTELTALKVTPHLAFQIQYYKLALSLMALGPRGGSNLINGLQASMEAPVNVRMGILQAQMRQFQGDVDLYTSERESIMLGGKTIIDAMKKTLSQIASALMVFVDAVDSVATLDMKVIRNFQTHMSI